LLVGEMITGYWSAESQVQLSDGQTTNYVYDIRTPELAVLDQSPADHDNVTVVPAKMLKTGAVIDSDKLPFEVRIDDYYRNSQILGPMQAGQAHVAKRATAGEDASLALVEQPTNPGTSGDQVDMPAAYVSLHRGQQNLGTFLLSTELLTPQHVQVDGKTYAIALRFKRTYKPYTLTLVHFEHDRYLGTDEAKNFASRVRILDPAHHVDREVVIWMNHPLRYGGDTIYQQGFSRDDKFTTLQVVWSRSDPMHWFARVLGSMGIPVPANPLPYIACLLGAIGLLIHFGMHLTGFLRRNAASRAKLAEPVVARGGKSSYSLAPTTPPLWQRPAVWASLGALALAVIYVAGMALAPVTHQPEPYHLDVFGRLPVVSEGRVLPFDSLARNTLRIVHGRETLQRDGQTVSAIQWLIEG